MFDEVTGTRSVAIRNDETGLVDVDRSGERIGQGLKGQPFDGPNAWSAPIGLSSIGSLLGMREGDFTPVSRSEMLMMSAVISVLDVRAQDISVAPFTLRQLLPNGGSKLVEPGEHKLAELFFDVPNSLQTWPEFTETLVYHMGMTSNAYVIPKRVSRIDDTISELILAAPARVLPQIDQRSMRLFYRIDPGTAFDSILYGTTNELFFWQEEIAHIAQRRIGGLMGISTMTLGGKTLSMGAALQRYQDRLFRRDSSFRGVITVPGDYGQEQYDRLKLSIQKAMDNHLNKDEPLVVESGGTWTKTSMTSVEAGMKEFFDQMVGEVCRLWRVPQHKVGHLVNVKYENRDSAERSYFKDSLLPLATSIEDRLSLLCLSKKERVQDKLFVQIDREVLELSDAAAVSERTTKEFLAGYRTRGEARVKVGLNPGPGDNVYSNPANTYLVDPNNKVVVAAAGGAKQDPAGSPAP